MTWRVHVRTKPNFIDHRGEGVKREARSAGLSAVKAVRVGLIYEVEGPAGEADVRRLADRLLTDPITQEFDVYPADRPPRCPGGRRAEIWLKKGVADPVGDTVRGAAEDVGVSGATSIRSGHVVDFSGRVAARAVEEFCRDHLMNALVQTVEVR